MVITLPTPRWMKPYPHQSRDRKITISCIVTAFFLWLWYWHGSPTPQHSPDWLSKEHFPLVSKYIEDGRGEGGRWYIPPEWYDMDTRFLQEFHPDDFDKYMDMRNPRSPAEAAQFALELCLRRKMFVGNSKIPLIIHQTWKNSKPHSWQALARRGAEQWLRAATGESHPEAPRMAYVFWDDEAVDELIKVYETDLANMFLNLPYPVERADIFRVVVLKWFGGIYADIDTTPLQHPSAWVHAEDLKEWSDPESGVQFTLHAPIAQSYKAPSTSPYRPRPLPDSHSDLTPASYLKMMSVYRPQTVDIAAIVGIEADTPSGANDYWRSGYYFPVQLTNWALALAPHHPIATNYVNKVVENIRRNKAKLHDVDPISLTGPGELTHTVKEHTEQENENFVWSALSGINDPPGGRGKIAAGDILVLPITGFSPGRGKFHNMGSQPISHRNARLSHVAQGSWRHTSIKVEAGKLCRTFLGGCREWSKIP